MKPACVASSCLFKLYRLTCPFGNIIPGNKKAGIQPAIFV
jgi:hypothetical protein